MHPAELSSAVEPDDLTFSKVLSIVEVDLTPAAVGLDQVALGAAQVDLTELQDTTGKRKCRRIYE